MKPRARISGLGKYLPEKIRTNADIEKLVDTSDAWIQERTGVRERRIAADNESASTMGIEAGRQALEQAEIDPMELDLVLSATTSPDGTFPATASMIQEGVGAGKAGAFDVTAACVGFLSALATGSQFIETGTYKRILVVGTEVLSRIVDWTDRDTCILFGDAAGAVVLEASDRGGPLSFVFHSDGSRADKLYAHGPATRRDIDDHDYHFISMDGRHIFKFAVQAMESAAREAIEAAGMKIEDVDLLVPHQANARIIRATAKALGLPEERAMVNVDRYGNTSAASIPVALREAWEQGRLNDGDRVVLMTFGGGLAWGSMVLEWAPVGPLTATSTPVRRQQLIPSSTPFELPDMDPCVFCERIAGRRDDWAVIERDELTISIINPTQFQTGQAMVIPARHAPTLLDLTPEEAQAVMAAVDRVARSMVDVLNPAGLTLFQNNGIASFQQVPHFHMHVVPRHGDGDWVMPPQLAVLAEERRPDEVQRYTASIERQQELAERIKAGLP